MPRVTAVFFGVGIVRALVSAVSMFLPRAAPIAAGAAGMLLTLAAFVYVYTGFSDATPEGVSHTLLPHVGFLVTGGAFLAITVLHVIPAAYRPLGGRESGG